MHYFIGSAVSISETLVVF